MNPNSITYNTSKKRKYHEKTLSDDAIFVNYIRMLDLYRLFSELAWIQLPVLDYTELGLGLLYSILPVDFEPVTIDYSFKPPTVDEALQGIWVKFEPVDFSRLYAWMTDFTLYVTENFKEKFQPEIIEGILPKAIYGVTPYGRGVYDPVIAREFLRATFMRLRLLRTPDISWFSCLEDIVEYIDMIGVTDEHVADRLTMILSAQRFSFVLGLSLLGRSELSRVEDGWVVIPMATADGRVFDLRFKTFEQLQFGFILGVTPLGYGLLLPNESIYKLPEGKRNPKVVDVVMSKVRGIISRLTLSAFSYSNYNMPHEMADYHKSDRTNQYHQLQTVRRMIEGWVEDRVTRVESNPILIRQYKNAVLQAVSWRSKRHRWGFNAWKTMSEEEFRELWKKFWVKHGLNPEVLDKLYDEMEVWLDHVRREKIRAGERVKRTRIMRAFSL